MGKYNAIVIGGSAGSFQVITKILSSLPDNFSTSIFLCLHRLKHVRSGFIEALSIKSKTPIFEPYDKEKIKPGKIYLAPANYHKIIEIDKSISLSTEKAVNHSRPSIDLLFESAASVYKQKLAGIILSGANRDGAMGLKKVKDNNGFTIVQDPMEAQIETMPREALKITEVDKVLNTDNIIKFLKENL